MPQPPSDRAYLVRYVPDIAWGIGGVAAEGIWERAARENRFAFPWKQAAGPWTEFRALYDDAFLYFTFRVVDEDIVLLDTLGDKQDVVLEDRVEMFFSRDDLMSEYYAIEIDPLGRTYDYRGRYYRQFDPTWNWPGLETRGTLREQGYVVEGRMPLASFETLGFPRLRPGVQIRCGLYRAEFSHDRSGEPAVQRASLQNCELRSKGLPPLEEWMAWVDPQTAEPDFHVPASLGWLTFE